MAASPDPASDDVFLMSSFQGAFDLGIAFAKSNDGGFTWSTDTVAPDGADRLQGPEAGASHINVPVGAVNHDGELFAVWGVFTGSAGTPQNTATLRFRRRSPDGVWSPSIDPAAYAAPSIITPVFDSWYHQLHTFGSSEISAPAIAIDNSRVGGLPGPRDGWAYVVWPSRVTPTTGRINFIRSCDDGVTWSSPCVISTASSYVLYTKAVVDPRGNIGVAWLDNRYSDSNPPATYDLFFAWSTDGGDTWSERRISGLQNGIDPYVDVYPPQPNGPFFDGSFPGVEGEYIGLVADPNEGRSGFYMLVAGARASHGPADGTDIYSFHIQLRARGDFDGDFDIDDDDGALLNPGSACWPLPPPPYAGWPPPPAPVGECSPCAALDMDDDGDIDWDDFALFYAATGPVGPPRCDCGGPCDLQPACGESLVMGGPDAPLLSVDDAALFVGDPCALAARYASVTRASRARGLHAALSSLRASTATGDDVALEIDRFLDCLTALLDASEATGS